MKHRHIQTVASNNRCWYETPSNQYGAVPFITMAGKTFAKKTNAVPPSDMFFAAAIIMTYDELFSKPRHQNDPYISEGGGELLEWEEYKETEDADIVRIKPSLPPPPDSVSVSSTTISSSSRPSFWTTAW